MSQKEIVTYNDDHKRHLNEAIAAMSKVDNDITIISGDDEEILANKYLLSVFSSILSPLLSVPT